MKIMWKPKERWIKLKIEYLCDNEAGRAGPTYRTLSPTKDVAVKSVKS